MEKDKILQCYFSHRGAINGGLIGLGMAISIIGIGLIRTLFIIFCVAIGYYVGKRLSEDKSYITNLLDRILPPGTYR